jgi:ubiquinone/menaquinone biosynthesis C-methylase UbiE
MSRQGVAQQRTAENVKDFWNKEATEWGDNPQVTIRDHYFRLLELDTICELIRGRTKALDIGCGTGFSTLFYSQEVDQIIGADYAQNMVAWAQRFLDDPSYFQDTMQLYAPDGAPRLRGNIRFEQANIVDLPYPAASFDVVIAERVLINLPEQRLQDHAVEQLARVLRPGGLCALAEVTKQGHETVDQLRRTFGLPIIEKYWHNLYVDEDHFRVASKTAGFQITDIRRFETFHFLTKIMHPLIVAPAEPAFLAGFNRAAWQLSKEFPTYKSVAAVGLETFLKHKFRPYLDRLDPTKIAGFDRVANKVIEADPDFSGCSHQVLHVLDRSGD